MKSLVNTLRNILHLKIQKKNVEKIAYNKAIPFIIKKSYDIEIIEIENIEFAVLKIKEENISYLKKHLSLFKESLDLPIILNILQLSTSIKNYLIENNISFVSKETIYMPKILIYFNDIGTKEKKSKNAKLSKLAQVVLISELLNKSNNQRRNSVLNIAKVAERFNVTKMSASRVLKELYEFEYLMLDKIGREKNYYLSSDINTYEVLSKFKNPKIEDIYIKQNDLKYFTDKVLSSYSALSEYADIVNNENIYAVEKDHFSKYINKNNQISIYDRKYDNNLVQVELWRYSPELIQEDVVDPISLYILLQDEMNDADSRLRNALEELKMNVERILSDSRY